MNWIRENRFLAGLLGVLIACVLGFGFFLWYLKSDYEETSADFDKQATEFTRLRTLQPYPNAEHVAKMKEEEKAYFGEVEKLKRTLASMTLPIEPMTPQEFQDKLRLSVAGIDTRAKESRPPIGLPPKFYLGFDAAPRNYQAQLPAAGASGPLGRQLKAIEIVMQELIDNKIDTLLSIKRTPLPEETGAAAAKPSPGGKPGAKSTTTRGITKYPIDLSFLADQEKARTIINRIVGTDRQFYLIRLINIQNQALKGPVKASATAGGQAPPPVASATPPPSEPPPEVIAPDTGMPPGEQLPVVPPATGGMDVALGMKFTLGAEKIMVTLRIEVLDFPAVAAAESPAPK